MTFITGGLPPMANEIKTIMYNIQLLSMNQSFLHNLPSRTLLNGFTDTFEDKQGVDLSLSTAIMMNLASISPRFLDKWA